MRYRIYFLTFLIATIICGCKKQDAPPSNNSNQQTPTKEKVVEVSTRFGNMYIWLYKGTPDHRNNFLALADTGFFDSTTFHRIIPNFVIQGGDVNTKDSDPSNDGTGDLGYTVPAEIDTSLFKHIYGAVAAARLENLVNPSKASNSSQFYIVVDTNGEPNLDNEYTVFGYVMKGLEVAVSISQQPRSTRTGRPPLNPIKMGVKILEKTKEEISAEYNYDITGK